MLHGDETGSWKDGAREATVYFGKLLHPQFGFVTKRTLVALHFIAGIDRSLATLLGALFNVFLLAGV